MELITMFWPWPFIIAGLILAIKAISMLVGGSTAAHRAGFTSYREQWRETDVANWLEYNRDQNWDDERKEREAAQARESWHKRYGPL